VIITETCECVLLFRLTVTDGAITVVYWDVVVDICQVWE